MVNSHCPPYSETLAKGDKEMIIDAHYHSLRLPADEERARNFIAGFLLGLICITAIAMQQTDIFAPMLDKISKML